MYSMQHNSIPITTPNKLQSNYSNQDTWNISTLTENKGWRFLRKRTNDVEEYKIWNPTKLQEFAYLSENLVIWWLVSFDPKFWAARLKEKRPTTGQQDQ